MKGPEIFSNSKALQNLLADFLPCYQYESARNIIKIACDHNFFAILLDKSIPEANHAEYTATQMTEKARVPLETTKEAVS